MPEKRMEYEEANSVVSGTIVREAAEENHKEYEA
jgi:hypothetical protein